MHSFYGSHLWPSPFKIVCKKNVLVNLNNDTVMLRGISLGDLASQNYYEMGGKNALDMLDVLTDTLVEDLLLRWN